MILLILSFTALLYGITRMIVEIFKPKEENNHKWIVIVNKKEIEELRDQYQQEANMVAIEKILNE